MIPNCKKLYLCTPDNQIVTVLNGVQTDTVDFHPQVKGYSELSFIVDRYIFINGQQIESNGYEDINTYMNIYLEDIGYFQIQPPSVINDGNRETKEVVCFSVEKEFEAKDWKGIKINTGAADSMEYVYEDNINSFGFAKRYFIMYDAVDPRFSFLHMIIQSMSSMWGIGYVDAKVARMQIPNLEIDNENLYAIMTSEVAPRLSCIFVFDYLNYTVNVYHKDSLDFDTGIFIGFRNLANQVEISVEQDSIYTRFTVSGEDDLNINYFTYGTGQIMNLNYFLREPYMDETLVTKYKAWEKLREDYFDEYIATAREASALSQRVSDLNYTVPSDDYYWRKWDNMSREDLVKNKEMFLTKLQVFQVAVDPRPNEDKYYNYGTENERYAPKLNAQGEIDHDWYLDLLYEHMGEVNGYYTYSEIVNYVIPYIDLALENLDSDTKQTPEEAGIGVLTDNWDLYGYEELEGVRQSYEEDLAGSLSKYSKDWDDMTEEERQQKKLNYANGEEGYEDSAGRKEYKKLKGALGDPDNPEPGTIYYRLAQLDDQIGDTQLELDDYNEILIEYRNIMRMDITDTESYEDMDGNIVEYSRIPQALIDARNQCLFTEDEISLLTTLIHDTDYQNSNIFVTELDNLDQIIAKEKELYDDANDKLFEVSQPQYTFSVTMDNMLRLAEYNGWYDEANMLYPNNNEPERNATFGLLRFIYVGLRDDYVTKLRVIGYRWNPCEITPDLTIEFSNMITSKSGRSDLVQLLELENSVGSKNSITIGSGVASGDSEVLNSLVNMITTNSIFKNSVSGIASGVSGVIDTAAIQSIIGDYASTLGINVGNLTGTGVQFDAVFSSFISSDVISTKVLAASQAKFEELTAKIITVGGTQIVNDYISTAKIKASQIDVEEGSFGQLAADIIDAGTITVDMIEGDAGKFKTFFVDHLDVNEVFGQNANFTNLVTDRITSNHIATKLAQIGQADVNVLFAENAFVTNLQAVSSGVVTSTVNSQYVKNLVAQTVNFAEAIGGTLTLGDGLHIESDNGHLVMNGTAIQIYGEDENGKRDALPGIQLGYDTENKPSLIVRNSEGSVIINPTGITQDAVADSLIVTRMLENDAVTEEKVAFNVATANEDGTISIETIKEGNGNFSYNWTQFKNETRSSVSTNLIRNSKTLIDSRIKF